MLNLLEYVLVNLRLNKNILIPEDNYAPNILKSNLLVLDKAAPASLLSLLSSHHIPFSQMDIDDYISLSTNKDITRDIRRYKEPNGIIITQKIAQDNSVALASLLSCGIINIPIIIYTCRPKLSEALEFIRGGIIDYWSEYSESSVITSSLENLLLIDRKRKFIRELFIEIRYRIGTLTKREAQVIDLLFSTDEDMTNKKIAHQLKLSPRTVEGYRATAMEKLAIDTKNELVLIWMISQQLKFNSP